MEIHKLIKATREVVAVKCKKGEVGFDCQRRGVTCGFGLREKQRQSCAVGSCNSGLRFVNVQA